MKSSLLDKNSNGVESPSIFSKESRKLSFSRSQFTLCGRGEQGTNRNNKKKKKNHKNYSNLPRVNTARPTRQPASRPASRPAGGRTGVLPATVYGEDGRGSLTSSSPPTPVDPTAADLSNTSSSVVSLSSRSTMLSWHLSSAADVMTTAVAGTSGRKFTDHTTRSIFLSVTITRLLLLSRRLSAHRNRHDPGGPVTCRENPWPESSVAEKRFARVAATDRRWLSRRRAEKYVRTSHVRRIGKIK